MAAGATYEPIATYTLGSNGTIDFQNIPQTYTDLHIVFRGGIIQLGWVVAWRYNDDSSSIYSFVDMISDPDSDLYGSTTVSNKSSNASMLNSRVALQSSDLNSVTTIDIFNYSNSSIYKTHLCKTVSPVGYTALGISVGMWRNNNAITSIKLFQQSGGGSTTNLFAGSKATLYGIASA